MSSSNKGASATILCRDYGKLAESIREEIEKWREGGNQGSYVLSFRNHG